MTHDPPDEILREKPSGTHANGLGWTAAGFTDTELGVMMKRRWFVATRRTFGNEFKREAVRLVGERGVAVVWAARGLELHESVLRKWGEEAGE